ncbi:MAG: endolytic transglycosylase MltG, partial [bacterium]|nr:endolytic transglycosylase MltG [bacterium]
MESGGEAAKWVIRAAALAGILALIFLLSKLPNYVERKTQEKTASNEVAVTIPEGLNISQIGEILEKSGLFLKSDFEKAAQKEEGFIFPDTYRFYKNSNPGQVIARMRENFDNKITPEILAEIKSQNKTLPDIITMASLLEEEAKSAEDRKLVAGILWKRLKVGIGLQV